MAEKEGKYKRFPELEEFFLEDVQRTGVAANMFRFADLFQQNLFASVFVPVF